MRISSGAIMRNVQGKILVIFHNKLDMYSVPSGKGEEDESPMETLCREIEEETGVFVVSAQEVREGEAAGFKLFLFDITYAGVPVNKEPDKHSEMLWLTIDEIKKLDKPSIYLDWVKELLG